MNETPKISEGIVDELIKLTQENINHYNNLINYLRSKLSRYSSFNFEQASIEDKKVLSEFIFIDCIHEISSSFIFANDALQSENLGIMFSLLRKPLRDLLACMEFISFDHVSLVEAIINDKFESVDPSKPKVRDYIKAEMKTLIYDNSDIFKRLDAKGIDALYEHRYGTEEHNETLSGFLDQSLHLITTRRKGFRTSKNSLNYMPSFMTSERSDAFKSMYVVVLPLIFSYVNQLIYFNLTKNFKRA